MIQSAPILRRIIAAILLLGIATGAYALISGDILESTSRQLTQQQVTNLKPSRPERKPPTKKAPPKTETRKKKTGAQKVSVRASRPGLPGRPRTVQQVVDSTASFARRKFEPACKRHGIAWPPARLTLLAFKSEEQLEIWGANVAGSFHRIGTMKILAASGGPGPKRKEGDRMVPEGFYRLSELNPNSLYHLSILIDYPNGDDIANSTLPRGSMGSDIYIHGYNRSDGCLALGDPAIELLFPLVALVPPGARRIIIAPFDFRRKPRAAYPPEAPWVHALYNRIKGELRYFPIGG